MGLVFEPYLAQQRDWPSSGRHILAHFDAETIVVYQAFSSEIGRFAVENGYFGGEFSYERMSWIKPNFLWMMYRSGWGIKRDQEITLALRIRRSFFDSMLAAAVPSTWDRQRYSSRDDWSAEVQRSSVRLQWDPDHYPNGDQHERRAIQLGLRDDVLEQFGRRELLEVIDLSDFVEEQRRNLSSKSLPVLMTPQERVYRPQDEAVAAELRLADWM